MKKLIFTIILVLTVTLTWASKVKPGISIIQQKDGTSLSVRGFGDVWSHWYETVDGVLLVHNGYDYFIAITNADGTLTASTLLAHNPGERSEEEQTQIELQNRSLFFDNIDKIRRKANTLQPSGSVPYFPHMGTPRVLVILAEFQDEKFRDTNVKEVFEEYLNAETISVTGSTTGNSVRKNTCSVSQYFRTMSFGAFSPTFDVYGPITLSGNMKVYGANDNMSKFVPEVCDSANAKFEIDFSEYDANNDNYVDLVYIIYAGYGENMSGNSSDCIWPHVHTVNTNKTYDGKKLFRYGVSNELIGNPSSPATPYIAGIGLFCHEFSHAMGMPDIYPSNSLTAASVRCDQNMDNYDIMDGGEYNRNGWYPAEYLAWERERLGWMQIEELTEATNVELAPLSYNGHAYKIVNDKNPNEYLVLENIQQTGINRYAPWHGMLVYRIQENKLGAGYINATAGDPAVVIIAADSLFMPDVLCNNTTKVTSTGYTVSGYSGTVSNAIVVEKYAGQTITEDIYHSEEKGDPWPGTSNVTEMTQDTFFAFSSLKTLMTGKPITEITEENGIITFKFKGGLPDGIQNLTKENQNSDLRIFTLDGRFAGTSKEKLKPGIYIQNNKKVIIR